MRNYTFAPEVSQGGASTALRQDRQKVVEKRDYHTPHDVTAVISRDPRDPGVANARFLVVPRRNDRVGDNLT